MINRPVEPVGQAGDSAKFASAEGASISSSSGRVGPFRPSDPCVQSRDSGPGQHTLLLMSSTFVAGSRRPLTAVAAHLWHGCGTKARFGRPSITGRAPY